MPSVLSYYHIGFNKLGESRERSLSPTLSGKAWIFGLLRDELVLDEGVNNFDEKNRWMCIEEACESFVEYSFVHFIMTYATLIYSSGIKIHPPFRARRYVSFSERELRNFGFVC